MPRKNQRSPIIDNAPMQYAPTNEMGVVFLFSHVAKRLRVKIEQIRTAYPDCIAYQRTGNSDKKIRIEFEHRSRNFHTQGHDPQKCDWLVCWEHNWANPPKRLRIIELRKMFGLGLNVWIVAVTGEYKKYLWNIKTSNDWSVPSQASKGDIILFYSTKPEAYIKDIFFINGNVSKGSGAWRKSLKNRKFTSKIDWGAPIRRVCQLKAPIHLEDMKIDQILKNANFVRGNMQARANATEYWPHLYDRIIKRNPSVAKRLQRYSPDRLF